MTSIIESSNVQSSNCCTAKLAESAHMIATNDDLLIEILLRVPVRSLIKFKSVSKRWLLLISDPFFCHRRNHQKAAATGLFVHRYSVENKPVYDFIPLEENSPQKAPCRSLKFVHEPHGIQILQSCNGLLCCCTFRGSNIIYNYYIYNPTTNKFTTLPHPTGRVFKRISQHDSVASVHLAFDATKSPYYRVVCAYNCYSSLENHFIEIYSSETGHWKLLDKTFKLDGNLKQGVFWNGSINWLGSKLLSFDVCNEHLNELPLPTASRGQEDRKRMYFGESRGQLHLIEIYGPCSNATLKVWEIDTDISGWSLKYHVDLEPVTDVFPEDLSSDPGSSYWRNSRLSILGLIDCDDEESYVVFFYYGKAIRYNFRDCSFWTVFQFDKSPFDICQPCFGSAFQFFESLACI